MMREAGVTHTRQEEFSVSYPVLGGGFFLAGRASGEVKRLLGATRLARELIRRVVIATYEAEMNICIHAISGHVSVSVQGDRVTVVATDRGPGIADIEKALTSGYSTAPPKARALGFGAGLGFTNMRKCADSFKVTSEVGSGTSVAMEFRPRPAEEEG